jgi:hypothetical protein
LEASVNYADYKIHPLADAFPLIEGDEFDELVASIGQIGLREPIVMHEGVVIDGRNRLRACLQAGVDPHFSEHADELSVPEFIWFKNANRRHLTADMKAAAATEFLEYEEKQARQNSLANLAKGPAARRGSDEPSSDDQEGDTAAADLDGQVSVRPIHHPTSSAIAERAGVSRYKAEQAIAVKRHDDEHGTDLVKQVQKGTLALRDAERVAKGDPSRNGVSNSREAAAARIETIREMAAKGHCAEDIAQAAGIAPGRVRIVARRNDIHLPEFSIGKRARLDVNRIVGETAMAAHALTAGLDLVDSRLDEIDESQLPEWIAALGEAVSALNKLLKTLKRRSAE